MYKRKIMGILKYGTDTPTKTQAFKKEDCCFKSLRLERRSYELMLLQQKAAQTTAGIRASGRKAASSSSGIKKSILF
jgi:hypothetical protein